MTNKEIAMKAMQELFVKRNATAIDQYWADPYTQHNPNMENGLEGIRKALPFIPSDFSYEPGIVIAEGDIVMAHSRVVGWGAVPQIIVDIFRLQAGRIVEHWDVIQPEVLAADSKNGNPMTSSHVQSYNMASISLPGNSFRADVGPLSIDLSFGLDKTVTFTVNSGAGLVADGHSETLPIQLFEIRRNIFFLGWTEHSGATVTHLEDYSKEALHTHITMPDATFLTIQGTIVPLTTESVLSAPFDISANLGGKRILQRFDGMENELFFQSENAIEIRRIKEDTKDVNSQTVAARITAVDSDCFLVSWQEQDNTTFVQIVDLASLVVHSNITCPGKGLKQKIGSITIL